MNAKKVNVSDFLKLYSHLYSGLEEAGVSGCLYADFFKEASQNPKLYSGFLRALQDFHQMTAIKIQSEQQKAAFVLTYTLYCEKEKEIQLIASTNQ